MRGVDRTGGAANDGRSAVPKVPAQPTQRRRQAKASSRAQASVQAAAADQELRKKVPSKSASAKKLPSVEPPEATVSAPAAPARSVEAPAPAATPPQAAKPELDQAQEAVPKPAAAPANDSQPPMPRPGPSFGAGNRVPGGVPGRIMPPPRPMAKAENFVEGDHVVYPTHGVGKVERIATEEIAGHKLELIHITFEENRMTLRVPVAKARSAGLRKLATRKLFDEALAVLKGRARIKRTMWSRRAQEYEAKINSGDPLSIAEVVRDLHRNSGQPDQSFSERQIYEAAMDRLAAELAALERIDKAAAATKLVEFLKTV
jgi:CarD family transcriptional regulator